MDLDVGAAKGRPLMTAIVVTVVGCATSGIVAPLAASAQVAGDRVRMTLPSGKVVGVLTETRSAELVLTLEGGGQQTVAREEIRRLERSLGVHGMARERAGTGARAAWFSSFVVPAVTCWWGPCPSDTTLKMTGLAAGWVLAGAGVGALVGTLVKEESWETMEGWSSPGVGERIRVTLPSGEMVGVLRESGQGELVLALEGAGGGQRTVARDDIWRLERSLGAHRQTWKGADYGLWGGIATGGAFWLYFQLKTPGPDDGELAGEQLHVNTWALSLLGAGAGALVGTFIREESWETIEDRDSAGMTSPRLLLNVRPALFGETPSLLIGGQLRF